MEPNNKRYTDLVAQVKVTQKKLRTTNNQIDGLRIALLQLERTLQKSVNDLQETKAEDRSEMIDNIEKRETILDEVYSRIKTEIGKMPEAKKQPEEAIEEHSKNLKVRKALILEIEACIKSGEMSLDVNAQAKAREQEALNEVQEEAEEKQPEENDELPQEEEKPADPTNLVNGLPFDLEAFEERITKKVQTQCREECKNFLDAYFNQRMTNETSPATHSKIACAGCAAEPIVGIRYQCTVRKDYNLCERCEDKL